MYSVTTGYLYKLPYINTCLLYTTGDVIFCHGLTSVQSNLFSLINVNHSELNFNMYIPWVTFLDQHLKEFNLALNNFMAQPRS